MTLRSVKSILGIAMLLSLALALNAIRSNRIDGFVFFLASLLFFFLMFCHPRIMLIKNIFEPSNAFDGFKTIDHVLLWTSIGLALLGLYLRGF